MEIKQAKDGRLIGVSSNTSFGAYHLLGEETAFGIMFTYRGTGDTENLVGVILLRKQGVSSELEGQWWQVPKKGMWIGGSAIWNKE